MDKLFEHWQRDYDKVKASLEKTLHNRWLKQEKNIIPKSQHVHNQDWQENINLLFQNKAYYDSFSEFVTNFASDINTAATSFLALIKEKSALPTIIFFNDFMALRHCCYLNDNIKVEILDNLFLSFKLALKDRQPITNISVYYYNFVMDLIVQNLCLNLIKKENKIINNENPISLFIPLSNNDLENIKIQNYEDINKERLDFIKKYNYEDNYKDNIDEIHELCIKRLINIFNGKEVIPEYSFLNNSPNQIEKYTKRLHKNEITFLYIINHILDIKNNIYNDEIEYLKNLARILENESDNYDLSLVKRSNTYEITQPLIKILDDIGTKATKVSDEKPPLPKPSELDLTAFSPIDFAGAEG